MGFQQGIHRFPPDILWYASHSWIRYTPLQNLSPDASIVETFVSEPQGRNSTRQVDIQILKDGVMKLILKELLPPGRHIPVKISLRSTSSLSAVSAALLRTLCRRTFPQPLILRRQKPQPPYFHRFLPIRSLPAQILTSLTPLPMPNSFSHFVLPVPINAHNNLSF